MKKRNPAKPTQEKFHVFVKLRHADGDVEPRRLYLENFSRFADAVMAAHQAKNDPHVISAWVEAAPKTGGAQ